MPTTDYSTWLTKQAAADEMGVSVKTIENLGVQLKLASALWRNPAGGPNMRVYSPDDVQRLTVARQTAGGARFTGPVSGAVTVAPPLPVGLAIPAAGQPSPELGKFLEALELATQPTKQVLTTKLCLTIPEAAEFAGVSKKLIHGLCVDGTIGAFQDGRVWRIPRARLTALYGAP